MMRSGTGAGVAGLERRQQLQPRRSKVRRDLAILVSMVLLSPVIFVGGRVLLMVLRVKI